MILIYCSEVTQRVSYIFNFIFRDILLTEVSFTNSISEFDDYEGPKLVYGAKNVGDNLFFKSTYLLFEKNIHPLTLEFIAWNDLKVFFPVSEGELPFDPFAAAFYLVSRYEEYLPGEKDRHNRYKPQESIAWKGDFLNKPVINIWATEIRSLIQKKYPKHSFIKPGFTFTPTIDIDNAFAFKYKGLFNNSIKAVADFFTMHFRRSFSRIKVLARLQQDPYDSYNKIKAVNDKYNIKPLFFFLLGDKGQFDRNLSSKNPDFRKLITRIADYSHVGIHPSYGSNQSYKKLTEEKERLESILKANITKSRQHYIKLSFPETYRNLIKSGIKEDYSMGYPSISGFRAGCCTPFMFYDLQSDEITDLKVFPFVFMDTTLKVYLNLRSAEVLPSISSYIKEVKKVGGHLIYIFHNESIGTTKMWKHWENMYEDVIKIALKE